MRTAKPGRATSALSPEDIRLFRLAMDTVTPAKPTNRAQLDSPPVLPQQLLRQRRERASGQHAVSAPQLSDYYVAAPTDHDDRSFVQARHAGDLIKGLQRGKWPVQATLDLHGCTVEDARNRMDVFLQACIEHRLRCVRIVHGKGYGSRNGTPVLKEAVRRWLAQLATVKAYVESAQAYGGSGSVDVLLSK